MADVDAPEPGDAVDVFATVAVVDEVIFTLGVNGRTVAREAGEICVGMHEVIVVSLPDLLRVVGFAAIVAIAAAQKREFRKWDSPSIPGKKIPGREIKAVVTITPGEALANRKRWQSPHAPQRR